MSNTNSVPNPGAKCRKSLSQLLSLYLVRQRVSEGGMAGEQAVMPFAMTASPDASPANIAAVWQEQAAVSRARD
jgi:hypothetical protein